MRRVWNGDRHTHEWVSDNLWDKIVFVLGYVWIIFFVFGFMLEVSGN